MDLNSQTFDWDTVDTLLHPNDADFKTCFELLVFLEIVMPLTHRYPTSTFSSCDNCYLTFWGVIRDTETHFCAVSAPKMGGLKCENL